MSHDVEMALHALSFHKIHPFFGWIPKFIPNFIPFWMIWVTFIPVWAVWCCYTHQPNNLAHSQLVTIFKLLLISFCPAILTALSSLHFMPGPRSSQEFCYPGRKMLESLTKTATVNTISCTSRKPGCAIFAWRLNAWKFHSDNLKRCKKCNQELPSPSKLFRFSIRRGMWRNEIC